MSEQNENIQHVGLGEVLDISTAGELKASLVNALEAQLDVVLEADSVEKADTSAMQVLAAFFNDAKAKGIKVSWHTPSEALLRSAGFLGLSNFLGLNESSA